MAKQTKHRTKTRSFPKKNGKTNGSERAGAAKSSAVKSSTSKPIKVSSRTKSVSLTDDERAVFSPLRQELNSMKLQLADLQVKIMSAETQRLNVAERIVALDKQLLVEAKGVAESHGIDTEDISNRWHLDTEEGVLTRVE